MSGSSRATQLRARWLLGSRVRAVWVVFDVARPLVDLAEDARADLPDLLFDLHVQAHGPETWRAVTEERITWLVLDLPAQGWADPRRDGSRRATTPAREKESPRWA